MGLAASLPHVAGLNHQTGSAPGPNPYQVPCQQGSSPVWHHQGLHGPGQLGQGSLGDPSSLS